MIPQTRAQIYVAEVILGTESESSYDLGIGADRLSYPESKRNYICTHQMRWASKRQVVNVLRWRMARMFRAKYSNPNCDCWI